MTLKLCIGDKHIAVNHYEGFKTKALMVIPTEQELTFSEILALLETSDLSEMYFYNIEDKQTSTEEGIHVGHIEEEHGRLIGYSKLISFNNNMESKLATFNFEKPNPEHEQITNLEMAIVELYEAGGILW